MALKNHIPESFIRLLALPLAPFPPASEPRRDCKKDPSSSQSWPSVEGARHIRRRRIRSDGHGTFCGIACMSAQTVHPSRNWC